MDQPEAAVTGGGDKATRYALVRSSANAVRVYLPTNYRVMTEVGSACVIAGKDHAGWTLHDYVLPRLASGHHHGEELDEVAAHSWDGLLRTMTVDPEGFSVVAKEYSDNTAEAFVYLGVVEVWSTGRASLDGFDDLDDFASDTRVRFADDLAALLDGDLDDLSVYFQRRVARAHRQART